MKGKDTGNTQKHLDNIELRLKNFEAEKNPTRFLEVTTKLLENLSISPEITAELSSRITQLQRQVEEKENDGDKKPAADEEGIDEEGWEIIPPTTEPSSAPTGSTSENHSFIPSSAPSAMPSSTYEGFVGTIKSHFNNGPDGPDGIC